jgi:prophage DNA circulation protein
MSEPTYAPRPGEIKKVIVVAHSGGQVSTYETLIEALTAVYRLDADLKRAIETAVLMATGETTT